MKRLCFLSSNPEQARQLVADLESNGIPEKHIYVISRPGTDVTGLPDEGPEADDFLPSYSRGLTFGGGTGLAVGLLARLLAPAGLAVTGGAIVITSLLGAGLGGFLTGLAGSAFSSSRLKNFQAAIEEGQLLVIAEVPKDDVERYQHLVKTLEPGIQVAGVEPRARLIP